MSFDSRNEIETRFVTNIDEQSFDEVDKRLKDTAENASKAEQAIVSVQPPAPIPFDVLPGGGGGSGRAGGGGGGGLGQANEGLRQLSGAASLLGDEAGQAAGLVADTGGQVIGFAQTITQLGTSLGPTGIAVAATAVLVGGALAFAFEDLNSEAEETTKMLNAAINAQIAYNEALDMTSESIEGQIEANNRQVEANSRNIKSSQESIDSVLDEFESDNASFFEVAETIDIFGNQVDSLTEKTADLTTENEGYAEALNSAEVAANDATQALLGQVDQIEETRKFEQDALAGSAEENNKRAESIANEQAIIREQIATLEQSGDTSEEVKDRIEELNGELGTLGQQSDILNSSAVQAAEAQKVLADAEKELEAAAEKSAKEVERAASKTASARQKERKVISEANAAAAKAKTEELEAVVEQEETLAEFRADAHDAQIDAEKDFNKSIDDLVENQSFLDAIDKQDDFVDEEQSRRDEARKSLIALQMDLAEERIEKEIAAQEDRADRQMAIAEAAAVRASAERDEIKLRRDAANDTLKLQRNRGAQELDLQSEINKNLVEMLTSVVDFSGEAANRVDRILSQSNASVSNGGKRGKRGKNNLESVLSGIMR